MRKTLPTLLRNYRTTPHRTTGATPSQLLMQRELRTKIPSQEADNPSTTRQADQQSKKKGKERNRNPPDYYKS